MSVLTPLTSDKPPLGRWTEPRQPGSAHTSIMRAVQARHLWAGCLSMSGWRDEVMGTWQERWALWVPRKTT